MPPPNTRASANDYAFTLTELLISIAVLTLVVLLVARLFDSATSIITRGNKRFDADEEARLVLDRIGIDLGNMVRRPDLDFFGKDSSANQSMNGNDQLAFYSGVPGYYSTAIPNSTPSRNQRNPISVVAYAISDNASGHPHLVRLAKGLVWEADTNWQDVAYLPIKLTSTGGRWPNLFQSATATAQSPSGMADADFESLGDSVFRFEYCYVLQPTSSNPSTVATTPYNPALTGHDKKDFYRDVAAVIVSIGVLDPTSRAIVTDYSQIRSENLFPDATSADIAQTWTAAINQSGFADTARIPKTAAAAIRIYQRRFVVNRHEGNE